MRTSLALATGGLLDRGELPTLAIAGFGLLRGLAAFSIWTAGLPIVHAIADARAAIGEAFNLSPAGLADDRAVDAEAEALSEAGRADARSRKVML